MNEQTPTFEQRLQKAAQAKLAAKRAFWEAYDIRPEGMSQREFEARLKSVIDRLEEETENELPWQKWPEIEATVRGEAV